MHTTVRDDAPSRVAPSPGPAPAAILHTDDAPRHKARRIVDRSAAEPKCRRPHLDDGAADDWLTAWCGLHARRWQPVLTSAERARRHYASAGQTRRQVEMLLIRAIALARLDDRRGREEASRAADLFERARLRLYGRADDPFAGDLPFLFAYARRLGLVPDHPRRVPSDRRDSVPEGCRGLEAGTAGCPAPEDAEEDGSRPIASVPMLLRTARWQYELTRMREMLPHVEWMAAEYALAEGRYDASIDYLRRGLAVARESNDEAALRRNIGVFTELAARLGHEKAARATAGWTPDAPDSIASENVDPFDGRALGSTPLSTLAREPYGLRRLTLTFDTFLEDRSARAPNAVIDGLVAMADDAFQPLEHGPHGQTWAFLHAAGRLLEGRGRPAVARDYLRRAVERVEILRASIDEPALRQRFFREKRDVYRRLVDNLTRKSSSNGASPDLVQALRVANGLKARGLIDLLDGRVRPERTVEVPKFNWTPAPNILRAADQIRRQLDNWQADVGPSDRRPPAPPLRPSIGLPERLVDQLDDRTAVVEYLVGPTQSYVWIVTDDGMEMRRLAGRRTLEPLVDAFMDTLVEPRPTARQRQKHHRLAERLYVELIGPFDDLVVGDSRLVVAADNLLYDLPFEALARPSDDRHPNYLIERHTVTYTPSLAALLRLTDHRSGRADADSPPSGALLLGAPDLDRPALDLLSLTDRLPKAGMFPLRRMFPELPGLETELEAVGRLLDDSSASSARLRSGAEATESFVHRTDLAQFDILHLATHGLSDAPSLEGDTGSDLRFDQPALLLTQAEDNTNDGVLTLGEILTRQTRARMVVLSGCTTGRGWRALGEGAYGLAGAFLYTGAQNVVASTWDVSDRDTTALITHLYRAIGRGRTPSEALNAGQRAVMDDARGDPRPPYFWAGFRTIGGGSVL